VCAPYNCIQNYKHKVKLNPGTTKRGQAVKTALEIFQRDKTTSAREKDMIKSMKDQDVSRNMPGKVSFLLMENIYIMENIKIKIFFLFSFRLKCLLQI